MIFAIINLMKRFFAWLKQNKVTVILLILVVWLWSSQQKTRTSRLASREVNFLGSKKAVPVLPPAGGGEPAPRPEIKERLVVEESNISLVVDQVRPKVDQIVDYVTSRGGYLVSSSISQPQEAPFATLVVRLPNQELRPSLAYLRQLAIKVSSENLQGWDVTDEYFDLEARLNTLYQTKAKFEEILAKAEKVGEILQVQEEIINLQEQIDRLKGRQQYLEKTAQNAKLTIYLSTDEWSLPYNPQTPSFRPKVIFKQAVRSLVLDLRKVATAVIWLIVYSPLWLPPLFIYRYWQKRKITKQ